MAEEYVLPVVVFLLGLCVGSFLNVCIYRLPKGQSVVRPRSRCPGCGQSIAAYDNIPILSYFWLRGRCRHCATRISLLYPTVELLTGAAFVVVYQRWDFSVWALKETLLASALIVLIFTDLRDRLLPDRITLPGMALGAVFALWIPVSDGTAGLIFRSLFGTNLNPRLLSLADGLLGGLVGGGLLFALGEIWYRLRKVEAMGFGDVKMMGMVGLFVGLKLTVLTLLLGSLVGSLLGGAFMLFTRKDAHYELPLGTFLGVAALLSLFWGTHLVEAYLNLFK